MLAQEGANEEEPRRESVGGETPHATSRWPWCRLSVSFSSTPLSLSLSLIAPAIFRPRFRRVYVYVYVSDLVGDHHQEGKERKGANLCLSGTRSLE